MKVIKFKFHFPTLCITCVYVMNLFFNIRIVQPVFKFDGFQFEFQLCYKTPAYLIKSNSECYDRSSWLVFYLPVPICLNPFASDRLPLSACLDSLAPRRE